MGVTSKIVMGFMGVMVAAALSGNPGRASKGAVLRSPDSSGSLERLASNYTNTAYSTPCHVSFDGFERLYTGMSYDEAAGALGCRGREESRSEMVGYSTVMYGWDGSGSIGANMNAMFQNDRMVSKAQFGLR